MIGKKLNPRKWLRKEPILKVFILDYFTVLTEFDPTKYFLRLFLTLDELNKLHIMFSLIGFKRPVGA